MTMLPASASSGDRRSPPPTSGSSTRSSGTPAWEAASRLGCSPSPQTWSSSTPAAPCCLPARTRPRCRPTGCSPWSRPGEAIAGSSSPSATFPRGRDATRGSCGGSLFRGSRPSVLRWSRHGGTCWRGGNGTWRNGPATATRRQPRSSARSAHLATSGRGRRPATHLRGWDGSSDNSPSSPRLRR
jgi:hypothetical protein